MERTRPDQLEREIAEAKHRVRQSRYESDEELEDDFDDDSDELEDDSEELEADSDEELDHGGSSEVSAPGYVPPEGTPTYSNKGRWKDTINAFMTGRWRYKEDPTDISGVHFLERGAELEDGYYAYAYRVSDNRIAYTYTGKDVNTNNAVAHSYLASGGKVYAAAMFSVQGGQITWVNSASGHYEPHPKVEFDWTRCEERQTSFLSLEVFRNKLVDLGVGSVKIELLPFRHPNLVKDMIDCKTEKTQLGPGLSAPTMPIGGQPPSDHDPQRGDEPT